MKNIYTKTGDKGQTSLYGGRRVSKSSLKVECYGTIDELNSALGIVYSTIENENIKNEIGIIQGKLFELGAELASDQKGIEKLKDKVSENDIEFLEKIIDSATKLVGKQTEFVVPGVNQASSYLHHARTIARRAERRIVELESSENIREVVMKYVNRLSDTFYAMARMEEHNYLVREVTKNILENLRGKNKMCESKLDLELAEKLAKYAKEKAKEINVPMVISVVDEGGNLVLMNRMDESLLVSIDISINKAFTAVSLKLPTHELTPLSQPGSDLYGIQNTNNNKIVIFGGGYPLEYNGRVVGGFGISGGSVQEDMIVAKYAIDKVYGRKI